MTGSGTFGKYEVVEPLNPGAGFGPGASLALNRDDPSRLYVIKRYGERGVPRARVLKELRQVKDLDHPAIAQVVEWYEHGSELLVVFAYSDGVRLERIIDYLTSQNERLSDDAIWFVGRQICGALACAHETKNPGGKPLVHGHLGPDRIRISWRGEVALYGLGLHALFGDEARSASALMYRAPEQRSGGAASVRSDAYGAALILWTMLTGRRASPNNAPPQAFDRFREDVPTPLSRAIDTALEPLSLRRAVSCRGLEQLITTTYQVNDKELSFNMDVYRGLDVFTAREVFPEAQPEAQPEPPPAREEGAPDTNEDSTVKRLTDLFDALEVGVSAPPPGDITDDGWLVEAVRKSAPQFSAADLTPAPRPSASRPPPEPKPQPEPSPQPLPEVTHEPDLDSDPVRVGTPPPLPIERKAPPPLPEPLASPVPPPLPVDDPEAEPEWEASCDQPAWDDPALDEPEEPEQSPPQAIERRPRRERTPAAPVVPYASPYVEAPPRTAIAAPAAPPQSRNWGVTISGAVAAAAVALSAAWLLERVDPVTQSDPVDSAPETAAAPATNAGSSARPVDATTRASAPVPNATADAGEDAAASDVPEAGAGGRAPVDEADLPVVVDELGDAPTLASEGYLIVRSTVKAEVVVNGVPRGFTNHKVKSSCYTRNVRLRDPLTLAWLSKGEPIRITCMATTTVIVLPETQ